MKRLSTDKTKADLAKDGDEEEDVGYVHQWQQSEDEEEEEETAAAGGGGEGASTGMGGDDLAQKFKGSSFLGFILKMAFTRLFLRGCVGRSVGPSVRPSVGWSVSHTRVEFLRNCKA